MEFSKLHHIAKRSLQGSLVVVKILLLTLFLFVMIMGGGYYWLERNAKLPTVTSSLPTTEPLADESTALLSLHEPDDGYLSPKASVVLGGRSLPKSRVVVTHQTQARVVETNEHGWFSVELPLVTGANLLGVHSNLGRTGLRSKEVMVLYLPDLVTAMGEDILVGTIRENEPNRMVVTSRAGTSQGKMVTITNHQAATVRGNSTENTSIRSLRIETDVLVRGTWDESGKALAAQEIRPITRHRSLVATFIERDASTIKVRPVQAIHIPFLTVPTTALTTKLFHQNEASLADVAASTVELTADETVLLVGRELYDTNLLATETLIIFR